MTLPFPEFLLAVQQRTDQHLKALLPSAENPAGQLVQAMHYSTVNGGKRLRPLLVFAAAQAVSHHDPVDTLGPNALDRSAAAIECIHAYSLVHDDLPAMDDDDLRRGQPTCHIAFDEATAILAGDALQCQAFEILAGIRDLPADQVLQLVQTLSHAAGAWGMVAGQAIDLSAVNSQLNLEQLQIMHAHKTGALIKASVLMGAIAAGRPEPDHLQSLTQYADAIGLAFQVQDDILDVIADTDTLGKRQGADQANNKPTYVSLLGLDAARTKARELEQQALDALALFDDRANRLRQIAAFIVDRGH